MSLLMNQTHTNKHYSTQQHHICKCTNFRTEFTILGRIYDYHSNARVCVVYVFMAVVCNVLERTSARKSFVVIWLMDLFSLPFLTLSLCVVAF